MDYRIKGNKVMVNQNELKQYLEKKVLELSSMATNLFMSVIILSLLVILNYMLVPYYYLFALVLVPLVGRGLLYSKVESYLRGFLKELLEFT